MPHTIRDVMTAAPVSIGLATTARELIDRFEHESVGAFPVVNDDGTLAGIVTKLDLLRALRPRVPGDEAELERLDAHRVADLMRPGVFTLEPEQSLEAAIDLMVETRLRSLPVVERPRGGAPRLVGMVSQGDVLRALVAPGRASNSMAAEQ
jgi:CBS-domain-containing membrane protein